MTIEEGKTFIEPTEELETVSLDDNYHEKTTKIEMKLSQLVKHSIVQFLRGNKDMFAWSHEYMPDIDPKVSPLAFPPFILFYLFYLFFLVSPFSFSFLGKKMDVLLYIFKTHIDI